MGNLFALVDVFRKGSAVADPALWRNRGGLTAALALLFMSTAAAAKGFGYDLPIDHDTAMALGGSIAFVVGLLTHAGTTPSVGLLPARTVSPVAGPSGDGPASGDSPAIAPVGGIDADTRAAAQVWARDHASDGGP